ncbi:MAG TPA: HAD family hydrolase [Bacillota bacterium]|nr:HAD family hydrolase [Bacillota bacterium]
MQKQYILFNLDDTLAHCNKYFHLVINQFTQRMCEWFSTKTKQEIEQKQLEIDLASIAQHGLTSERFVESLVDTYNYFLEQTGRTKEDRELKIVKEIGKSVFEMKVEPYPQMNEILQQLKEEGHELYLHTGGDKNNQMRKITQLELGVYFENRIFISSHKDTGALEEILQKMNFDRSRTWMVGNSLRTDILTGLECGIHVIYIPAKTEWKYNEVKIDIKPQGAFYTLDSLDQVPKAIHEYICQQA